MKPTRDKFSVLSQICKLIPAHFVAKTARQYGVDKQSRSFTPWSHVVSLVFAQLAHALSLNDICDTLQHHSGNLLTIRRATASSRNGLSHANRTRNADMAEQLFWAVFSQLQKEHPKFGSNQAYCGLPRRFKRLIHVVDSTTIQLVANCLSWAKHRRRKAAAKCHLRLNLQTFLPNFILVKAANSNDAAEARTVCQDVRAGEIIVFDRAYLEFAHLYELHQKGVFFVTRAKANAHYLPLKNRGNKAKNILQDVEATMVMTKSLRDYPEPLRYITANVEVNGKKQEMTFIANNLDWAATSVCDLYKARWGIEVFFKQLKQTLQLADFLGHNQNAVRWQIWTALLTYLLLRFLAFLTKWRGSFSHLFTLIRGVLWSKLALFKLVVDYGTAPDPPRLCATPFQAYLPGFAL